MYFESVKNLSYNNFEYLTQEFGYKFFELLKENYAYPFDYMDSFKTFSEEKLSDKVCSYSSVKNGTAGNDGEKLNDRISDEVYLTGNKIWNEFSMKNTDNLPRSLFGKRCFLNS